MSFKVFLSYSTKDIKAVNALDELLKSHPLLEVFVADNSILPGEDLSESILEEIEQSDLFLLL